VVKSAKTITEAEFIIIGELRLAHGLTLANLNDYEVVQKWRMYQLYNYRKVSFVQWFSTRE